MIAEAHAHARLGLVAGGGGALVSIGARGQPVDQLPQSGATRPVAGHAIRFQGEVAGAEFAFQIISNKTSLIITQSSDVDTCFVKHIAQEDIIAKRLNGIELAVRQFQRSPSRRQVRYFVFGRIRRIKYIVLRISKSFLGIDDILPGLIETLNVGIEVSISAG
ncbi:MAG TPA: hypothetical protein DEB22_03520 [Alcanivorax sp.]|nr:hypothetical protein [Alcanivorax sp.]